MPITNSIDGKTPLVSYLLLSYNHEKYISDAVKSAMHQNYENIEIIISDDCSSDSTYKIIESLYHGYNGSKTIEINKNFKNMGLSSHFNYLLKKTKGDIIVVAAGDDISLPDRVSRTVEILKRNPDASLVSFRDITINSEGDTIKRKTTKKNYKTKKITLNDLIKGRSSGSRGASRGFRREVYETFGDLNDTCPTEDTPFLLRGLILGNAIVSHESGILYRKHDKNLSRASSINFMNFVEIKRQYIQDAEIAFKKNLIDSTELNKIIKYAEDNFIKRKEKSLSYQVQPNLYSMIKFLLKNNGINFFKKIKLLKKQLK